MDGRTSLSAWLKSPIALWLFFFCLYTIIHLASWAAVRYRLPTDAVMIIFAAVGVVELFELLRSKISYKRTQEIPAPAQQ